MHQCLLLPNPSFPFQARPTDAIKLSDTVGERLQALQHLRVQVPQSVQRPVRVRRRNAPYSER